MNEPSHVECICDHHEQFHFDWGCVMFGCDCDAFLSQRDVRGFLGNSQLPIVPADLTGSEYSEQIIVSRNYDSAVEAIDGGEE